MPPGGRRNRYPQLTTPEGRQFMATVDTGFASIRHKLNKQKQEYHTAKTHCTFCGKDADNGPLKSCSLCKAVRYCDRTCQISDYKARHKHECANFTQLPTTPGAFLTKPLAGERYPIHPLFGHWHEDGVGCWVTIEGCIDCDLRRLADDLDPSIPLQDRGEHMGGAAGFETIRTHKAAMLNLLDLRVLVQNRRKDKTPVLVFGSRAQVLSQPPLTFAVLQGTAEGDNLVGFARDGVPRVAMGVAKDPWDKAPRVGISSINGTEVKKDMPLPANIKDKKEATVLLNTGDYVILHLQFRVGDGDAIYKDWQALSALEAFFIPWASCDGTSMLPALSASLPTVQSPAARDNGPVHGRLLRAPFDHHAVREYFADFIERGQDAYTRSHFGDAHADMLHSAEESVEMAGEEFLRQIAQDGNTIEVLARHLRDVGMTEFADKVARAGRQ